MIKEKYPDMFAPQVEVSTDEGWNNILDALCSRIKNYLENNKRDIKWAEQWNDKVLDPHYEWIHYGPRELSNVPKLLDPVRIRQVKEKFGTLRFYYYGGDEYISGLVDMAEGMSARTCEECGAPGAIRTGGWIKTLCDKHAEERGLKLFKPNMLVGE